MHFSKSTLHHTVLSIVSIASAQSTASDGASSTAISKASSSSTTSSASSVQTVRVDGGGGGPLTFTPDQLTADPGTKIEFRFEGSVHSVAQGAFDKPCKPLGDNAFYSGLITAGTGKTNTFTITVNDTNTIWFYCSESSHCPSGMSGVINPPTNGGQTLDQYKSAASKAGPGASKAPAAVQGGVLGSSAATSPQSSTTSSAAAATSSGAAAGVVGRGNIGTLLGGVAVAGLAGVVGGLLL